jgi:hypothetical protein
MELHVMCVFEKTKVNINNHKCHLCSHATSKKLASKNMLNLYMTKSRTISIICAILHYHVDNLWLGTSKLCMIKSRIASAICVILQHHIQVLWWGTWNLYDKIKDHKYNLCYFTSSRHRSLARHVAEHEKIKDHKCNLCNFVSSRQVSLVAHVKYLPEKLKNHKCNQCDFLIIRYTFFGCIHEIKTWQY